MKKIFLSLLLLLSSCYNEYEINPNHPEEYLGVWNNEKTTINEIPDDVYPNNNVIHYIFQIAQSEVMLPTGFSLGTEYQNWKIDKMVNPPELLLYIKDFNNNPDMTFKIIQEPFQSTMQISYNDTIKYYLKK